MLTRLARALRPALADAARAALRAMTHQGRTPARTRSTGRSADRAGGGGRRGTSGPGRGNRASTDADSSPTTTTNPQHGGTAPRPAYPGDHRGPLVLEYDPRDDAAADPGEVVWAWVPYEEDHSRGKDRPALVVGREEGWLLALPLTSKDHDLDAEQEARAGRHWVDVGAGAWDTKGRPSEARVDRVVRIAPDGIRRAGVRLDRAVFDEVAREVARHAR